MFNIIKTEGCSYYNEDMRMKYRSCCQLIASRRARSSDSHIARTMIAQKNLRVTSFKLHTNNFDMQVIATGAGISATVGDIMNQS